MLVKNIRPFLHKYSEPFGFGYIFGLLGGNSHKDIKRFVTNFSIASTKPLPGVLVVASSPVFLAAPQTPGGS